MKKPHVLIFIDWYLPGYKAGGPIRSAANLVEALHGEYEFSIVTTDRDLGDKEAYEEIEVNEWVEYEHCKVWYASPERQTYRHIRNLIFDTAFDVLYVQSMFSLKYTLFPLWTCRALRPESKMILAPRGMLHAGAMGLKSRKKKWFLRAFKWMQLHKSVTFQATDDQEAKDIVQWFGKVDQMLVVNLPKSVLPENTTLEKETGILKLVFYSRLTIKKGVHILLEALRSLKGSVQLDLYGVQDEPEYWQRCTAIIEQLPENIQVNYCGTVPPHETTATLQRYHAMAMPTQGENFGHAIFESLAAGRPVLISDQTPWRDLVSQKAGWDLTKREPEAYRQVLQQMVEMNQEEWKEWSEGAYQLAASHLEGLDAKNAYQALFSPMKKP